MVMHRDNKSKQRLSCITDLEYPVLCVELGDSQNMDEAVLEACEEAKGNGSLALKRDSK